LISVEIEKTVIQPGSCIFVFRVRTDALLEAQIAGSTCRSEIWFREIKKKRFVRIKIQQNDCVWEHLTGAFSLA
jgi:hypothetical protein